MRRLSLAVLSIFFSVFMISCNSNLDGKISIRLPSSSSRAITDDIIYEITVDGPSQKSETGKSGDVILIDGLIPGQYKINCDSLYKNDRSIYAQGETEVEVIAGEIAQATIRLEKKCVPPEITDIKIGDEYKKTDGSSFVDVRLSILMRQRGMYSVFITPSSNITPQTAGFDENYDIITSPNQTFDFSIQMQDKPVVYTITLSYASTQGHFTITKEITVPGTQENAAVPTSTLESISVTSPTKTVYYVGEEFDSEGMTVTATYADGKSSPITDYTISGFDSKTSGEKTVTLTYSEGSIIKSAEITITVKDIPKATYALTESPRDANGKILFGDWPQSLMVEGTTIADEEYTTTINGWTCYVGSDAQYYVKEGNSYFKLEPITWVIINTNSTNEKFLLAENILDSGIAWYTNGSSSATRTVGTKTIYPNNYEYSQVRAYLNGQSFNNAGTDDKKFENKGFLQMAFTETAQGKIKTTTVDNSASSAGDSSSAVNCSYGYDNTYDKIFLLSEKELTESPFEGYTSTTDSYRIKNPTQYASSKNASSVWWQRSQHGDNRTSAMYVDSDGSVNNEDYDTVTKTTYGIVPAMWIVE